MFGKHGRVIFALSFMLGSALSVVCAWRAAVYTSALIESFIACVVFMLLPAPVLTHIGLMLQTIERGSGESGLRRYVAARVKNLRGNGLTDAKDGAIRWIHEKQDYDTTKQPAKPKVVKKPANPRHTTY